MIWYVYIFCNVYSTVWSSGHLLPMDQPAAALEMITRFTNNISFVDEWLPSELTYATLDLSGNLASMADDTPPPPVISRPVILIPTNNGKNIPTRSIIEDHIANIIMYYWRIISAYLYPFRMHIAVGLLFAIMCCLCYCCCWCFRRRRNEITVGSITYTDWRYVPVPDV